MLSIEEALNLVAAETRPLAPQRLPLSEAAGLVLAEEIASEINSPPYHKALMDGYAVRSADGGAERKILEELPAGAVPRFPITLGTASRIMTGAPLPEGADCVVPVEQTESINDTSVRIHATDIAAGQNVLPLGASIRAGDVVLRPGAVLRAIEIAVLAEVGHRLATIVPRPRVAVLPTGNELVRVGDRPATGQIRNSNGPMLAAAASRAGAEPLELGIARDTPDELRNWIEQGFAGDVLLISGGVSAGKFDLVPQVLAELGVATIFHKVALRPGKPLWFGVKTFDERRVLVFALPGNPVSSLVCFELFVRPALAALAGRGFREPKTVQARLQRDYDHPGGRAACLPALVTSDAPNDPKQQSVEILPWQGSADVFALTKANGLAYFSTEKQKLAAGSMVKVILI